MDIVLNTNFNNPNLPKVLIPGFIDSFNRPAASTLGVTDDGKTWEYSSNPWSITATGRATKGDAGAVTWVDGFASDGELSAVFAAVGTDQRNGLLLRRKDSDNYIYVCPNTSGALTLYVRIDNATSLSRIITGETLNVGDTLSVVMDGPTITVKRNGAVLLTETVNDLADQTCHGFFGTATGAEWDSIEFVPA